MAAIIAILDYVCDDDNVYICIDFDRKADVILIVCICNHVLSINYISL